ncbi:DUF998 domain-containing protein [Actinomycetospora sp. C-140]
MSTLDRPIPTAGLTAAGLGALDRVLLLCGIAYALVYVLGNDVVAAARFPGYDWRAQNVSELSALGSPARPFELVVLLPILTALMVAFGVGVWRSARGGRALRIAGTLVVACGLLGLLSIPFPMTSRAALVVGGRMPATDVGHIALTAGTVLLIIGMMGFASVPLPTVFRAYTAVSAFAVLVFGVLTGSQAPQLAAGAPTPWMGLSERISIGAWLLWMVVLAVVLLAGARNVAGRARDQR